MIKGGIKPKTKDERDFKLGSVTTLPDLSELPEEFVIALPPVVDQRDTDFCAAAASCLLSSLQEGVELGYEWLFAVAKMIEGGGSYDHEKDELVTGSDPDTFGLELRTACKAHVKYGCIERKDSPFSVKTEDQSFLRRIENWPKELFSKALPHKKGSFFSVEGQYDAYDDIRATMWKFRGKKVGTLFGVMWSWALSQVYIKDTGDGFGHALGSIGFTAKGLYVQNSAGPGAGEGGRHYFSREVINEFVSYYGAYCLLDIPREKVEDMIENNIKIEDSVPMSVLKRLLKFFKDIFSIFFKIIIKK